MMKTEDNNLYWVWLSLALGPACSIISELLEKYEGPYEIYSEKEKVISDFRRYFTKAKEERFLRVTTENAIDVISDCDFAGVHIISPESDFYPKNLLEIKDFPIILYGMGNLSLLKNKFMLAVVGTREMTPQGCNLTLSICKPLAAAGVTIVSGFNVGGDEFAHKAAMNANKNSIAVLAYGFGTQHRAEMRYIGKSMLKNGSLFITEFPMGTEYSKSVYHIRNRIISGMTNGVLVTQAPRHSGTIITANLAISQGRDVFSIPYDANNIKAQGNNLLIKEGAIPVTDAGDIIINLWPQLDFSNEKDITENRENDDVNVNTVYKLPKRENANIFMAAQPSVNIPKEHDNQSKIIKALQNGEMTADEIVQVTSMPTHSVMAELSILEISGEIEALPGKRFKLK